jgi:hypothetical protein
MWTRVGSCSNPDEEARRCQAHDTTERCTRRGQRSQGERCIEVLRGLIDDIPGRPFSADEGDDTGALAE